MECLESIRARGKFCDQILTQGKYMLLLEQTDMVHYLEQLLHMVVENTRTVTPRMC
jgi:hypothetical protein